MRHEGWSWTGGRMTACCPEICGWLTICAGEGRGRGAQDGCARQTHCKHRRGRASIGRQAESAPRATEASHNIACKPERTCAPGARKGLSRCISLSLSLRLCSHQVHCATASNGVRCSATVHRDLMSNSRLSLIHVENDVRHRGGGERHRLTHARSRWAISCETHKRGSWKGVQDKSFVYEWGLREAQRRSFSRPLCKSGANFFFLAGNVAVARKNSQVPTTVPCKLCSPPERAGRTDLRRGRPSRRQVGTPCTDRGHPGSETRGSDRAGMPSLGVCGAVVGELGLEVLRPLVEENHIYIAVFEVCLPRILQPFRNRPLHAHVSAVVSPPPESGSAPEACRAASAGLGIVVVVAPQCRSARGKS